MTETNKRENRWHTGVVVALIAVFMIPLALAFVPTTSEARHNDNRDRLEEINEEIRELIERLRVLFEERRELTENGNDYPDYADPRLIEARATVYTYDEDKKTRVTVVYDRKERTFYTSAKTRTGIVRAISRYYDIPERRVDRVLEVSYVRSSRAYDNADYTWSRSSSYNSEFSEEDYSESYTHEEQDYDTDKRWWGDATHQYITQEELEREKQTWWDNDGY